MLSDCIFCKIARGEMDTQFAYEGEYVVAFDDIMPLAPVHVLVVPRTHVRSVRDLPSGDVWNEMLSAVQSIAKARGVDESGFRIVSNAGPDGGQEVDHLHIHVIGGKRLRGIG